LGSPKGKTLEELNFTIKILFNDIFFAFFGWQSPTVEFVQSNTQALEGGLDRAFESVVVSLDPPPPAAHLGANTGGCQE